MESAGLDEVEEEDFSGDTNDGNDGIPRSSPKVVQLTLCVPRRGPAGPQARSLGVKGQPLISFLVPQEFADMLEGSAQVYTRDRLPVSVWLGTRDITPKGYGPLESATNDAPPPVGQATAPTPIGDAESAALHHHIVEQRAQLEALKAERAVMQAERAAGLRFLAQIHGEIETARERRQTELRLVDELTLEAWDHHKEVRRNFRKQQRKDQDALHELDGLQMGQRLQMAHGLKQHVDEVNHIRVGISGLLKREAGHADTLRAAKEFLLGVFQTQLGEKAAMSIVMSIHSRLEQAQGRKISSEEIAAMFLRTGQDFLERIAYLRSQVAVRPADRGAKGIGLTCDYMVGQLPHQAIEHFLSHGQGHTDAHG